MDQSKKNPRLIYIIPGLGEKCELPRYKRLISVLKTKGFSVRPVDIDWHRPLTEQVFPVEKEAIIFGFSFGAVLAYLIVKKYPCKKVIFGSMSPIHTFSFEFLVKNNREYMDKDLAIRLARDVKSIKVSLSIITTPKISLAGDMEMPIMKKAADLLVPKTKHYLSKAYIKIIEELVG